METALVIGIVVLAAALASVRIVKILRSKKSACACGGKPCPNCQHADEH